MYAGTTLYSGSGRIVGVHQRIDRAAHRYIKGHIDSHLTFPTIKDILHFEGNNGPDGNKRKSPFRDAQWDFINPDDENDRGLLVVIDDHIYNLTQALKDNNYERSAFEAAWLSHAVVDGLTPAHHYPLDKKIEELWGKPQNERRTIFEKNIIKGTSGMDTFSKNWQYWGAKGVFTAHVAFEWGVAMAIAGHKFTGGAPKPAEFRRVEKEGFEPTFMKSLHKINAMKLYDEFESNGWTRRLAGKTRRKLVPEIIKIVTLAWYYAAYLAKDK